MKKIAIFRSYFFLPSETFIFQQVNYLKNSFKIFLIATEFMNENLFDFSNLSKVRLNKYERIFSKLFYTLTRNPVEKRYRFYHSLQIKRLVRNEEIALIHAHFGKDALRIFPTAKKNNIPLVVTFHGYDASGSMRHLYYKNQLPLLFDYASKIIVVSKHMIDTLQLGPWMDKVTVLPCGVDVQVFKPGGQLKKDATITILHSGRLVRKKGVPDLIRVFARLYEKHRNLRLRIIGDGPDLEKCRQLAEKALIKSVVTFLGSQPHAIVKAELETADIFVLNSRIDHKGNTEGTPVSLLEAMSMCKAVISTYHAGIPDVIQDNVNGRLVPEKDNSALENVITELIADEEKRKRLGAEARKTIIESFSTQVLLPKLCKLLNNVAANPETVLS